MKRPLALALTATTSLGLAAQAMAQTQAGVQTSPPPASVDSQSAAQSLNTEISKRLLAADRQETEQDATYREAVARYEAELARYTAARELRAESLQLRREHIDIEQDLYNKRMADWRATVAACESGDRVRCESGKAPEDPRSPQ